MVRNDRRTRLLPKIIVSQLMVALFITLLALGVIFYTQGYRFNWKNLEVVKTGVIYLSFETKDVTLQLNNETSRVSSNIAKNVAPGFYNVTVFKDGFETWSHTLNVEASSVNAFQNVMLFRSNIKTQELSDQGKINLITAPTDILAINAPKSLIYSEYEIWIGQSLITRFSTPIQKAIWYPDLAHIVYQQEETIRVIDIDGKNDTLLATLSDKSPTSFAIGSRGAELYYIDSGKYMVATIR